MADKSTRDPSAFHALLGRALLDPEFRAVLKTPGKERDAALAKLGIAPDMLPALDESVEAINSLAAAFAVEAAVT